MRLDSSGNLLLGLGNATASAKLDIRQDSGVAIRCEDGSGGYFTVSQAGNCNLTGGDFETTTASNFQLRDSQHDANPL